jgi:pyrroline-5-carboxylate reductase
MKTQIGFIGGGRITRVILHAFRNKNYPLDQVSVAEIDPKIAHQLANEFPEITTSEPAIAASQQILFIALHPPVIMEMLENIKSAVSSATIVVSLAPKITMEKMADKLEATDMIVRLIPNATSYINEGYNPVAFSGSIPEKEKSQIMEMLQLMGTTVEVPEEKLEAYAIVSAMAPTYFWFQWHTLAEIGRELGMEREESAGTVYRTLQAALDLQFGSGLSPEEVMDLIPVKPIGVHESDINQILREKLVGLYQKIKP